jgi:hypothetical protein
MAFGHSREVYTMEEILRTLVAVRAPYRRLSDVELLLLSPAQRQDYDRRSDQARDYVLRVILAVETLSEPGAFVSDPAGIDSVAHRPIKLARWAEVDPAFRPKSKRALLEG